MKLLINVLALAMLLCIVGCASIKTASDQIRLADAVAKKDEIAIRKLVDSGVDVNIPMPTQNGITLLSFAAGENNHDLVNFLLERGAKTNVKDNQGYTPLNDCALQQVNNTAQQQTNSVKIAEMLLNHGADPNLVHCKS